MAIVMPTMPNRLPCRLVAGELQPAQRQDEADRGDEVAERGEIAAHVASPQPRFLNMASIRSVTAKPPKMFTEASTTAMKAEHRGRRRRRRSPAARRR